MQFKAKIKTGNRKPKSVVIVITETAKFLLVEESTTKNTTENRKLNL